MVEIDVRRWAVCKPDKCFTVCVFWPDEIKMQAEFKEISKI